MKNNKYADLVRFGLKPQTLLQLSESNIDQLHKSLIEGKKKENKEAVTTNVKKTTFGPGEAKGRTLKGSVTINPDNSVTVTEEGEIGEAKKRKKKKKEPNPWAICTAQLKKEFGTSERSMWSAKEKNKYERCVKDVKKSINEGKKDDLDFLLEEKIVHLLDKHIKPKMTKGNLLRLLEAKKRSSYGFKNEDSDTKTKPKTKPGTKTPPKEKPYDPFKPSPHKKPKPKAKRSLPSWLTFNSLGIKFKK
jgi:hypothetical protein